MFSSHKDVLLDNLPQNLSELTDGQISALLEFYNSMSIKELRIRQQLNNEQKSTAYKMFYSNVGYNISLAMNNLEIENKFLFIAIYNKIQ